MDPSTFRRDPFLRSSAYHLATWSLAALVLELRRSSPSPGDDGASSAAVVAAVVGGALLTSMTHERRVGKMAGAAGEPVFAGAGRMWAGALVGMLAGSVALAGAGWAGWLFNLWVGGTGATFARWGRRTGMNWYVGLGLAMVAFAAADAVLAMLEGQPSPGSRFLVLGVVLPGAALVTNRRFLWFREN